MMFQNDPFRDFDQFFSRVGQRASGAVAMPIDAYRRGDDVWVHIDMPGVNAESVNIDVERGVLTVTAEREWQGAEGDQMYIADRPRGTFRRQVHLGEGLDPEHIEADLTDGVLSLRIPVAEVAKPRKITVGTRRQALETSAS